MKSPNVIAPLAARTVRGYSLDREFYCDDAVFAADMEQVIVASGSSRVTSTASRGKAIIFCSRSVTNRSSWSAAANRRSMRSTTCAGTRLAGLRRVER